MSVSVIASVKVRAGLWLWLALASALGLVLGLGLAFHYSDTNANPGTNTDIMAINGYMCTACQEEYDSVWDQFKWARAVSADLRMQELRVVFEQNALSVRHKFEQGNHVISNEARK